MQRRPVSFLIVFMVCGVVEMHHPVTEWLNWKADIWKQGPWSPDKRYKTETVRWNIVAEKNNWASVTYGSALCLDIKFEA